MKIAAAIAVGSLVTVLFGAAPAPHAAEIPAESSLEGPAAIASPPPPEPRPEQKWPAKNAWPFVGWSYAKAYTYNFFEPSPVQSMVLTASGTWSKHISAARLVNEKDAITAARLVTEVHGTFETTKCTFPRHAIVYFDKTDKPVAALNLCFECEGLLVWPDFDQPAHDGELEYERLETKFMASLAAWKELFGAKLGLPVSYKAAP